MLNNFDLRLNFLSKSAQGLNKRNDLIAGNIANIETPGYKAKDIDFEQTLRRHLTVDSSGTSAVRPLSSTFDHFTIRNKVGLTEDMSGNNVDIDKEMVAMTENKMKYDLVVEAIKAELKLMNIVIDSNK
jgi:flagellar basal-body rod protein FlgB